jgi:hypothetical protein
MRSIMYDQKKKCIEIIATAFQWKTFEYLSMSTLNRIARTVKLPSTVCQCVRWGCLFWVPNQDWEQKPVLLSEVLCMHVCVGDSWWHILTLAQQKWTGHLYEYTFLPWWELMFMSQHWHLMIGLKSMHTICFQSCLSFQELLLGAQKCKVSFTPNSWIAISRCMQYGESMQSSRTWCFIMSILTANAIHKLDVHCCSGI